MKTKKNCLPSVRPLVVLVAMVASTQSGAALNDLGNGQIADTDINVAWSKDANLLATQYATNPNLIKDIIALTPSIADPVTGSYTLTDNDFLNPNGSSNGSAVDGGVTWFGAVAWINWLNSQNFAGRNDWRLPKVMPANGSAFDYSKEWCNGKGDIGYNITGGYNELSHLAYAELNTKAAKLPDATGECLGGDSPQPIGLIDAGAFQNFKKLGNYWTGTDYNDPKQQAGGAWIFAFAQGSTASSEKATAYNYVIPVWGTGGSGPVGQPSQTAGDYDIAGNSCSGKVDKRGRKVRLVLQVQNAGTTKKPTAKVSVTAAQNGQTYQVAPRSRKITLRPGKQKQYRWSWKTKGAGDVIFTASVSDADSRESDSTQDVASCTVKVSP